MAPLCRQGAAHGERTRAEGGVNEAQHASYAAIRANLFLGAHEAIGDWAAFPWHSVRGEVQAWKPHSSQALAIDVFGTIAAHPDRDIVLDALARYAGLPAGGPWEVLLEWSDPANLLAEPRPTQVDVLAVGANAILVIECKFTEPGGSCSQTKRIASGRGAGLAQCDGAYHPQVNPRSGAEGRCALSAKGIRYWDALPAVFALDPEADHAPCPFRGEVFQWMRNMVLAHELGRTRGKQARCIVAFAAGGNFPTEIKARSLDWLPPLQPVAPSPLALSYQAIIELGGEASGSPTWGDLRAWVDGKVDTVLAAKNKVGRP
ncbi:PGN_0703 family putative restriction endonuclease [Novosphingobium mangrovi (ex Hu et al. 2023)]|uniref:PD-(D/E)XK nuclease superfamily protein n=1 Tax=Novosphingobium mangrovi (ex Hu et al. 2023) TaxID=2930094 RepID=A0ABT0AEK9_9SPHN|nr:hypothetical protein [Novosphingobium mangrovi (ex Hu et al. 2023)]MCJ1961610.1 hypothetical protein [Novosphingobium mangrovi (ex Hu et al. 2023)]